MSNTKQLSHCIYAYLHASMLIYLPVESRLRNERRILDQSKIKVSNP